MFDDAAQIFDICFIENVSQCGNATKRTSFFYKKLVYKKRVPFLSRVLEFFDQPRLG